MRSLLIILTFILLKLNLFSQDNNVPRSEYPRPQFERKEWITLNGEWSYIFDFTQSGEQKHYFNSKGFEDKIIVPFAPESKLSGVNHQDFINTIWYHKKIQIPHSWYQKRVLLNFGAVYYESEIYLDGKLLKRHFGGSSSFDVDITDYVTIGNHHDLIVKASSDLRGLNQSAGKQSLRANSWGCNYTRTTGIWQSVWLEAIDPQALKRVKMLTDIDQKQLVIEPQYYSIGDNTMEVQVKDGGKVIAKKRVSTSNISTVTLPINNMRLWSPESPTLYEVEFIVRDNNNRIIDHVYSYAGMRKVDIKGNRVYLNNRPYYQRLVLDQGFYPEGVWTAPTDDDLRRDIELGKEAGFNGARLHQKVFEQRYHYWADKLGYITWGEAPSWGMDCNDPITARNFLVEWKEILTRDINHPSIIIWAPMNESWWPDRVQYARLVSDIYDLTKDLDRTRPVNTVSGGVHIKTDIWSVHNYEQEADSLIKQIYHNGVFQSTPNDKFTSGQHNLGFNNPSESLHYPFPEYDKKMPYLIDEFGGIKWSPNSKDIQSWGYGNTPKTEQEFLSRLESQVDAILSLAEHVWGYCYTQLTDVEQEENGVLFYDRTPKFDMKRVYQIFSKNPENVKR
ncbi:MAG: glycoside hydrolase family 2 protein [Bacteroidales bacterium]